MLFDVLCSFRRELSPISIDIAGKNEIGIEIKYKINININTKFG
jgi:hypothetical protein